MPFAVRILIAVLVAVLLYLFAVKLVRAMMRPGPPDEPDIATLRPVELHYRCQICGAEVTMTAAPGARAVKLSLDLLASRGAR